MWGLRSEGWSERVGGVVVTGGGSCSKGVAVVGVGSAAGCGGRSSERKSQQPVFGHLALGPSHTVFVSILGIGDAPLARGRSFYRCDGGRDRLDGRIGAGCGLRLRWLLFLFAAAEEAPEASFDLG